MRSRSLPKGRRRLYRNGCSRPASIEPEPHVRRQDVDSRWRAQSQLPFEAGLDVIYWGGHGKEGWDLEQWRSVPRICQQCDSIMDSWRGRFENAQVTLRMCASEGCGFKSYVRHFLMLSSKACFAFELPTFYRWSVDVSKKVLTERQVIGTCLDVYDGRVEAQACGVHVENGVGSWERAVRTLASHLRHEAHSPRSNGGTFLALVLNGTSSKSLSIPEMMRHRGQLRIARLLIVLGGPDGISRGDEDDLQHVLEEYTDLPLLQCSLPGGKMHSYCALATLFVLHDQGLLLPFLSHMAECN